MPIKLRFYLVRLHFEPKINMYSSLVSKDNSTNYFFRCNKLKPAEKLTLSETEGTKDRDDKGNITSVSLREARCAEGWNVIVRVVTSAH